MNILIVSGAFYPNNSPRSFRTTELVKQFVRLGHKITVYIPQSDYDYNAFLTNYPLTMKFYYRRTNVRKFSGISIVDRIVFRLINQFADYPDILLKKTVYEAVKKECGYDMLLTIAVPHQIHWAFGLLYKEGHKVAKTWIADCGDPYIFSKSSNYSKPLYFKKYEKLWCKLCDYITVPTEASKDGYYPEFRDKIRVIPQAFDFDEVQLLPYKKNIIPTFAYSGSFIPELRDPRPIMEYLFNSGKKFKAIFYTKQGYLFSNYKSSEDNQIIIKDYIPRLELLKELSQMDFLLNIANGNITAQTPSKLIDYALTGRPILTLSSLDVDKELLDAFLNGDYSKQHVIHNMEQYNIKNVTNQFLCLCNKE